jgi:arsenate reductase
MPSVIFLCVANSARSQIAEGLARSSAPDGWEVYSAGSEPGQLSRRAVEAMREIGIDISHQYSKGLDDVPLADADVVITLCAEEECPVAYTSGRRLAWPLPDPADPANSEEEEQAAFRAVRDIIQSRLAEFWRQETGAQ